MRFGEEGKQQMLKTYESATHPGPQRLAWKGFVTNRQEELRGKNSQSTPQLKMSDSHNQYKL